MGIPCRKEFDSGFLMLGTGYFLLATRPSVFVLARFLTIAGFYFQQCEYCALFSFNCTQVIPMGLSD
jgi:hypothetical protein